MKLSVTCSWCHEPNDLRKDHGKVFCWNCGHRADVPRVQCDCRKCRVIDLRRDHAQKKAQLYRDAS